MSKTSRTSRTPARPLERRLIELAALRDTFEAIAAATRTQLAAIDAAIARTQKALAVARRTREPRTSAESQHYIDTGEKPTHAIDCDMDEDCLCGAEPDPPRAPRRRRGVS